MTLEELKKKKTEKETLIKNAENIYQELAARQNEVLKEIISLDGQRKILDELIKEMNSSEIKE